MSLLLLFNQEEAEPIVAKSIPAYWLHAGKDGDFEVFSGSLFYLRPSGHAPVDPADPDLDLGWPMLRAGSITGLAYCTFVGIDTSADGSDLHVQARKNNSVAMEILHPLPIGVGNVGKKRLLQDPGIDIFIPGDVLTMSIAGETGVAIGLDEFIGVMEVSFADLGGGSLRRAIVASGHAAPLSSFPVYMRVAGLVDYTANLGTPVMRDCSIVGVRCRAEISSHSGNGTLTIEVQKNGTTVFSATSPTITGNGPVTWGATQAAGIDTLDADPGTGPDVIQTRLVRDSGTFSAMPMVAVDLEVTGP